MAKSVLHFRVQPGYISSAGNICGHGQSLNGGINAGHDGLHRLEPACICSHKDECFDTCPSKGWNDTLYCVRQHSQEKLNGFRAYLSTYPAAGTRHDDDLSMQVQVSLRRVNSRIRLRVHCWCELEACTGQLSSVHCSKMHHLHLSKVVFWKLLHDR
jgi:hypothetical protein